MADDPFETAVTAHHAEIHRYVVRMTRRAAEGEDLAQETFIRAYRAWQTLPAGANVRAWLFKIATNVCRNHFRGEKRRSRAHATVRVTRTELDADGPESETVFHETRTLVESSVARLPLKQRTAFILRKIHELDYDAIGQSLDCSAESARAHVFQALRKIRQSLNGHELPVMETKR